MSEKRTHREEYLYLPALTHDAALLAWGAFFFKVKQDDGREKWELLDDDDLREKAGRKRPRRPIIAGAWLPAPSARSRARAPSAPRSCPS